MKSALICGISGQDGAYLAKFLLERNYIYISCITKIKDEDKAVDRSIAILRSYDSNQINSDMSYYQLKKPDIEYWEHLEAIRHHYIREKQYSKSLFSEREFYWRTMGRALCHLVASL